MDRYAYSVCALSPFDEKSWRNAFHTARIRNLEVILALFPPGSQAAAGLAALARDGIVRPISVHLPFTGDISAAVEADRTRTVRDLRDMLEKSDPILIPPEITLHPSGDGVAPEQRAFRLDQVRRSLDELLPTAARTGSRLNLEFLPRNCLGNTPEELLALVADYDDARVGINFDVNHAMKRYREIPAMMERLGARIHALHLSDYDGVDEKHWGIGQGLLDWDAILRAIDRLPHQPWRILEIRNQLYGWEWQNYTPDACFALREAERSLALLADRHKGRRHALPPGQPESL